MTSPDDPAYENQPQHWNSTHAVTLSVLATEISALFSNANGISFGLDGTNITGSHNALTSQSNQAASASNGSFTFQTLGFSNANNVTFGTSAGSIVTASVAAAGAASVNFSAGTTSGNLDSVVFSNSNGISFGLNGSTVTGSHNALTTAMASNRGSDFVQATAAFAGTSASGTIASGGISVSIGPYITTAMLSNAATISNIRVSAGTTSNLLSALTFDNGNGITFGLNASTVTASHNGLTSQSNQAASASNGSFTFQTLGFSNANNVTFGTSAGSIVTASVGAVGAASVNFSAGTTSGNLDSVVFSNANGVSFGLNGSTVTGSVVAAGGGGTQNMFIPFPMMHTNAYVWPNAGLSMAPMNVQNFVTATQFNQALTGSVSTSSNSSYQGSLSYSVGIYTINGTDFSLASSGSQSYSWNVTSNSSFTFLFGKHYLSVPLNVSMTPGDYFVAQWSRSSTTNANWLSISNVAAGSRETGIARGVFCNQQLVNIQSVGFGILSSTNSANHTFSSAMPAAIPVSYIIYDNNTGLRYPLIQFANSTVSL